MKKITATTIITPEYLEAHNQEFIDREVAKNLSLIFMREANLRIEKEDILMGSKYTLKGCIMSEEEVKKLMQSLNNIKTHLESGYLYDRIEIIMKNLFEKL